MKRKIYRVGYKSLTIISWWRLWLGGRRVGGWLASLAELVSLIDTLSRSAPIVLWERGRSPFNVPPSVHQLTARYGRRGSGSGTSTADTRGTEKMVPALSFPLPLPLSLALSQNLFDGGSFKYTCRLLRLRAEKKKGKKCWYSRRKPWFCTAEGRIKGSVLIFFFFNNCVLTNNRS